MRKIRSVVVAISCVLGVLLLPGHSLGWEFQMVGAMNWNYEYYSQLGAQGFFGPYNVDNGPGNTANLNFWWNGARLSQNLVTGADASKAYFWVLLEPTIKINPAVRLTGRYRLAQWNNPQASYYYTQDAPGTDNAFSEGQWTMFWGVVNLPWGTLGVGKRPWKFGTGLQYDGADGLTTESLVLNAPWGPLDIGFGIYAHRPARRGQTITIDPYDLAATFGGYFNHADKSGVLSPDLVGYVVYNNGPLQTGVLAGGSRYHIGPEAALLSPGQAAPLVAQDSEFFHGTVYTKYNNGRFFFNAEAAWLYWTDRLSGPGTGAAFSIPFSTIGQFPAVSISGGVPPGPQRYTEQWRFMIETGAFCGPAKLSLISAWTPGPDRRNSTIIGKQSAAFVWHPGFDIFLGNYDVFRPYSWLFTYNYGSGFNAYNLSLDGYLRDAWVLGGRLDYAVASNLNVYGTFLWAERTSDGYGWGAIQPFGQIVASSSLIFLTNGIFGSPNIPDRALGWEVDAGFDWKLLEGFTASLLVAYWKPGKWFNYACIDRSVPGWNAGTAGNFWGTRPDKTIDGIFGSQFSLVLAF